ncbi:MAG: 4-hydroxyphenylpyruvate dioxygenase [Acidimicrobiales bacterium]
MTPAVALVAGRAPAPAELFLGWDHLELWVGNARAFAGFLAAGFGFDVVAYAGPETGVRGRASYVLAQGDVRLVVTAALEPGSPVAAHVRAHGDGVRDLAITVSDATAAYEAAVARGARGVVPPWSEADGHGTVVRATIAAYGDTRHTFVERAAFDGPFAPCFAAEGLPHRPPGQVVGLIGVDHCVANVEKGSLGRWVDFYRGVLGLEQLVHFDDAQISTEYSALMSTVVWDASKIVLPINEPAAGRRRSQIEEYLDAYRGPGIQHVALATHDIVATVTSLRDRGIRFLRVPAAYHEDVRRRFGDLDLPWDRLAELGVLVDRDHEGHLLQVFTETVVDRPTLFFEVIQRVGSRGFGAGNFKALFEAIEREQARRGNL